MVRITACAAAERIAAMYLPPFGVIARILGTAMLEFMRVCVLSLEQQ